MSAFEWRSSCQSPAHDARGLSDLGSVTLGSPLDPVVGGSLEDAFCCLIKWCLRRVPLASAKNASRALSLKLSQPALCRRTHQEPTVSLLMWKEATSSAGSAQVHREPHGSQA